MSRRTQTFARGDLVQINEVHISRMQNKEVTFSPIGVVLSYYDSNVYEPASCEVLVRGEVMHVSTRKLKMVKEKTDD